jgi:hypothetical protein
MGTKTVKSSSFEDKFSFSVDTSFPLADIFKLGGGASGGWGTTSTDSNSQTISSSGSLDIKVNGNSDGVDHDQDQFFLLLNPAVALKAVTPNGSSLQGCAPTQVNWQVGLFGSQTLETYTLSVAQLKNPQSLPPNVASVLNAHGFTAKDFANILTLDPFAQGQTTIDPVRFAPTTWALPYEPPPTGSDCPGGVCSCIAYVETLKNDFQGAITTTVKSDYNVGFNESAGLEIKDVFSATAKSTQTFTWSDTSSTENDLGGSKSASVTINCPSPAYTKPTDATQMLIYWDRLFGTFLFVPSLTTASQQPIHQGFLLRDGKPAAHVPVEIMIGGKTYHTITSNSGKYVFYGPTATIQKGLLSVGGQTFQLPLAPTTPGALEIQ